ncbi:UNVERIFIED_CONTAM: hypothetical protein GTU68_011880 [Idotea baltica]|nr:hypothetical protein [Idotea baltica]
MYKILHIVGNRPHFIKLAPVSRAIKENDNLEEIIVHTGQHYDQMMSGHFIDELALPKPNYNLEVGSEKPLIQFAKILSSLQEVIIKEKPDLILVYGDTNSTAAGAIAAAKSNIPLGHVESGLREHNKSVPEEINKLLTDAVTDLYFVPTQTGMDNLKAEGKTKQVYLTGDVGLDLVFQSAEKILKAEEILHQYGLKKDNYIFMTCHRAANTSSIKSMTEIFTAATQIKKTIFFPAHPRTANIIKEYKLNHLLQGDNWIVTGPIGFFETQALIKNAEFCLTDSGGVIKESYFHKTPAIIIDKQTEWLETINEGWNHIAGPYKEKIIQIVKKLKQPTIHNNSLGDGTAAKKIVDIIVDFLNR